MSENTYNAVTSKSLTSVSEAGRRVDVSRIETPKGERLELADADGDASIWLDAMVLESLTWEDEGTYDEFCREGPEHISSDDLAVRHGSHDGSHTELTAITNEFGHVDVRKTSTDERDWVEIHGPKVGFTIRLNVAALLTVMHQDHERFTDLLTRKLNR